METQNKIRPQAELDGGTPAKHWLWKGTVGNYVDSVPTFLLSKSLRIPFTQWRVRLHKFCAPDAPACYHTHPGHAWRLILWGGYIEETSEGKWHTWLPGDFGPVFPQYAHRIERLWKTTSWSLWIYGPKLAEVKLIGKGWREHA